MCIHTYIDIVHLHRLGIIMIHCGNPHQLGHGISQVGIGSLAKISWSAQWSKKDRILCPSKINKNN